MITEDFIYRLIKKDSRNVLVGISGLGLDIRNQREVFLRRYALKSGMSYIAFDCTQNAYKQFCHLNCSAVDVRNMSRQLFQEMKKVAADVIHANFSEKSLYFVGSCFGANLALHLANQFSKQTQGLVLSSPLVQYEENPVTLGLCTQLEKKIQFFSKRHVEADIISRLVLLKSFFEGITPLLTPEKQTYAGPMIILHPANDHSVPISNSAKMIQNLDRKNAELIIIPNETHSFRNDFRLKNVLSCVDKIRQKC